MSEVSTWREDLTLVISLNRSVRPAEAEDLLKRVFRECPQRELSALNPETTAALQSFLPKRRRLLDELLQQRLAATTDAPAANGRPGLSQARGNAGYGVKHQPSAQLDPVKLVINEIVRLNRAARPAEAHAKFRGQPRRAAPSQSLPRE